MYQKLIFPKELSKTVVIALLFVVLLFSLGKDMLPFTNSAFKFHDMTQYARVKEYVSEIKTLHIPPQSARDMNFGTGYPIFMFYAPAAYMVASISGIIGFSTIDSVMMTFLMFWFVGACGMYFLLKIKTEDATSSIFGAALYSTSPWWAGEIFVRGNLATCAFLAFAPWALWSVHRYKKLPIAVFVFVMLSTISHNALSLVFVPILLGYTYFAKKEDRPRRLTTIFLAILASAWFWVPAMINLPSTYAKEVATMIKYHEHFLCLDQIWSAGFWGYGASLPGCSDGMSFMLGKVQITAFVVGIILAIAKTTKTKSLVYFEALVVLWLTFMTLSDSRIIWEALPPVHVIQFPWRLLAVVLPFLAIGGGYFFKYAIEILMIVVRNHIPKNIGIDLIKNILLVITLPLLIFGSSKFFVGQEISKSEIQKKYLSAEYIAYSAAFEAPEYLPKSVNRSFWLKYRDETMPEDQRSILISQMSKFSPSPTYYLIGYLVSGLSISFVIWQSHTKKIRS